MAGEGLPTVGVVALQGDYDAHRAMLEELGVENRLLRHAADLESVGALVLPGGESTTLLRLMADEPWFEALSAFHQSGRPILATCAGALLLAQEVVGPSQPSLGFVDATLERNGWGRQVDSFEAVLDVEGLDEPLPVAFIRAPRVRRVGPSAKVLAHHEDEPVLLSQGAVLAATFHSEITGDVGLHRLFLKSSMREFASN